MRTSESKILMSVVAIVAIVFFGLVGCAKDAENPEETIVSDENGNFNEAEADAQLAELNQNEAVEPVEEYELSDGNEDAELAAVEEPSEEEGAFEEELISEAPITDEPAPVEDFDNSVAETEPEIQLEEPVDEVIEEVAEITEEVAEEPVAEIAEETFTEPVTEPVSYGETDMYIVQPGDTLGTIAFKILGTSKKWKDLANLNNLSNPNVLHPGDVLKFEKTAQATEYIAKRSENESTFTIQKGDSLSSIAKKILGSEKAWRYLWAFNRDTISNPHTIKVGQVIAYVEPDSKPFSGREAIATGKAKEKKKQTEDAY